MMRGEQLKKLKAEFELLAKEIEEAVKDDLDTAELPYVKTLVQDQEKIYDQLSKQKKRLETVITSSDGVEDKLKNRVGQRNQSKEGICRP